MLKALAEYVASTGQSREMEYDGTGGGPKKKKRKKKSWEEWKEWREMYSPLSEEDTFLLHQDWQEGDGGVPLQGPSGVAGVAGVRRVNRPVARDGVRHDGGGGGCSWEEVLAKHSHGDDDWVRAQWNKEEALEEVPVRAVAGKLGFPRASCE